GSCTKVYNGFTSIQNRINENCTKGENLPAFDVAFYLTCNIKLFALNQKERLIYTIKVFSNGSFILLRKKPFKNFFYCSGSSKWFCVCASNINHFVLPL